MTTSQSLTPLEAAKIVRVDQAKVVGWIKAGELIASNIATRNGGKPRYRIDPAELEAFLARRDHLRLPRGVSGHRWA